jgi:GNAT superfamily N-acetyltransferase
VLQVPSLLRNLECIEGRASAVLSCHITFGSQAGPSVVCLGDLAVGVAELERDGFTISTDRDRLDLAAIHRWLSEASYWAKGRAFETVERSVAHSLCFGVYAADGAQAGFARVVTDYTTFAWICDLFILEAYQGQGLGKWLVQTITGHPDLQGCSRVLLATRDAHELYKRYGGFLELGTPEKWMELSRKQ